MFGKKEIEELVKIIFDLHNKNLQLKKILEGKEGKVNE